MDVSLQNIDDYTKDLSWMLKALVQIEREFQSQSWIFTKPVYAQTAFEDIEQQLEPKITALIAQRGHAYFKQMLYRIDLSERQIAKVFTLTIDANFTHVLSNLIVKRCLQKVLIRNYYKSPEKDALGSSLEE